MYVKSKKYFSQLCDFSCQKFWSIEKKTYLCIRFRLKTGVLALKKEFFDTIYINR